MNPLRPDVPFPFAAGLYEREQGRQRKWQQQQEQQLAHHQQWLQHQQWEEQRQWREQQQQHPGFVNGVNIRAGGQGSRARRDFKRWHLGLIPKDAPIRPTLEQLRRLPPPPPVNPIQYRLQDYRRPRPPVAPRAPLRPQQLQPDLLRAATPTTPGLEGDASASAAALALISFGQAATRLQGDEVGDVGIGDGDGPPVEESGDIVEQEAERTGSAASTVEGVNEETHHRPPRLLLRFHRPRPAVEETTGRNVQMVEQRDAYVQVSHSKSASDVLAELVRLYKDEGKRYAAGKLKGIKVEVSSEVMIDSITPLLEAFKSCGGVAKVFTESQRSGRPYRGHTKHIIVNPASELDLRTMGGYVDSHAQFCPVSLLLSLLHNGGEALQREKLQKWKDMLEGEAKAREPKIVE